VPTVVIGSVLSCLGLFTLATVGVVVATALLMPAAGADGPTASRLLDIAAKRAG